MQRQEWVDELAFKVGGQLRRVWSCDESIDVDERFKQAVDVEYGSIHVDVAISEHVLVVLLQCESKATKEVASIFRLTLSNLELLRLI